MTNPSPWTALFSAPLSEADSDIARLIERQRRQNAESINLVASESYCPRATLEAEASILINKNASGYPPRVSFAGDFSKRLEPQPGMKVVYARTGIDSDRDQLKKLYLGYSDDVSVFLNGRVLFRGRSAQNFRDPGFLGIINPENDAVYLPLKKGRNELLLAVSELGGGWGFICRLADVEN